MPTPPPMPTQEELNRLQKIEQLSLTIEESFQSMASSLAKMAKNHKEISDEDLPANVALTKELVKSYNTLSKKAFDLVENAEKLNTGSIKSKDIQKQIEVIEKEKVLNARKYTILKDRNVQLTQEELRVQADAIQNAELQLDQLKEQYAEARKIEKTAGLTAKLFGDINKIPIVGPLVDAEKVVSAINKKAAETNSSFKAFGTGLSTTLSLAFKKLADPLVLLTAQIFLLKKAYDLFHHTNELITDQGKQLGLSYEESEKLYKSANAYLLTQNNSFLNEARIVKARMALNEAMGTSIVISNEEAGVAARLNELYGLSAEENAKIYQLGRQTNQTNKQILDTVLKTAATQKSQTGGTISYQNVLKKVSGVSGEILTKFKGNVKELTAAVMQADRLGLTLEQVEKVSESLLNFETSIENELKAELLTGKALNLERARSAALSGNTKELMAEIKTQVGDINKFEKLNVIARQSYAEAFGMSASEMGDMLRKQQLEQQFAAAGAKSAQERLDYAKANNIELSEAIEKDLEQRSLADLQKDVFMNLQKILAKIVNGPGKEFAKMLEKALGFVMSIVNTFREISGGFGGKLMGFLLFIPAILAGIRMLSGGMKGFLFQRGTDPNPMVIRPQMGMGGGMGGGMGAGPSSVAQQAYLLRQQNPSLSREAALAQVRAGGGGGGFGRFFRGGTGLATGLGLGMVGMGLNSVASGMEPGAGATAVGALGGAATGAGFGAMFGPWGAAIGGILGGVTSLLSGLQEDREDRKKDQQALAEYETKRLQLMEDLTLRPIKIDMGTDTIVKSVTNQNQYGPPSKLA